MNDFTIFCQIAKEEEQVCPALLIPLELYGREIGFFNHFEHFHLNMKEVKHSVRGKLETQVLNIAIGSEYNKDIDIELRPHREAANVLGQEQFPDNTGINRFLRRFTPAQIEDLSLIHALTFREYSGVDQVDVLVIDLDGFGLLAKRKRGLDFREFEFLFPDRGHVFARKGYFAHYPGKEGYQVFVAYTGQLGDVIAHLLDPGNTSPRSRFYDLYYETLEALDDPTLTLVWRFDGGIMSGEIVEFLIDEGQLFITKGNNSRTSRRLARRANNKMWEWVSPNQQAVDLGWIKIPNCRHKVRVILLRTYRDGQWIYSHIVLNIPEHVLSVKEAVDFYNSRQTVESMIKEGRRVLYVSHLRTSHYWGLKGFAHCVFLAHNLVNWFQRDVFGETDLADLGLKRFVKDIVRLPAQVRRVGRVVYIKLLANHRDARKLAEAIAQINAAKFGRQLGLPLIWGPGFRGAKAPARPLISSP